MDTYQRHFDRDLDELKKRLLHMAGTAEVMIDRAIRELTTHDETVAKNIPDHEQELNRLQIDIDEMVQTLIATHQPVASDLRFLLAATRINSELERIGDLVINITEAASILVRQPQIKPLIDIPHMAELARKMVRESLHAFVRGDTLAAQTVIVTDDQVDALKDQVLRELLTYMMGDPKTIERGLALILISRHLERIADHATNIAQNVIYVVQGHDVRHPYITRDSKGGTRP